MAGRDLGAHQRQLSIGAQQAAIGTGPTSVVQTQAVTATASVEDGYQLSQVLTEAVLATATASSQAAVGADVFVTQSVLATATASYGILPGFDELVTTGSWSTPVTFAAGDQFIVELTGSNAATNARCRISVQLGDA